LIYNLRLQG